jgi:hypothetical protein
MKLEELASRSQVYISEVPHYKEHFQNAEDLINSIPHLYAVSPTKVDPHPTSSHPYGRYMRAVIKRMMDCDAVYMLQGWEQSVGARLEHNLAAVCGMAIIYEETH